LYYLTYFRTESKNIVTIEQDCALSEMILRTLILKIDPKLVERMLAVGQNPELSFFQTVTEPQVDENGLGGDGEGRAPRRAPRREEQPVVADKDAQSS